MTLSDPSNSQNMRGILAMCFAMAIFMVNDTCVKLAGRHLPVGQIVLLRGLIGSGIVLALLASQNALGDLRHLKRPMVAFRCLLEGLTAITFIGALALLPIATVTAVFLSSPLIITMAAALFLGEQVRWRRWLAAGVGFIGVLAVLRPSQDGLNAGVVLALISTFLAVVRDLVTRTLPKDVPSRAVTVGTIMTTTIVGGILLLFQDWQPVSASTFGLLAMAAITVSIGNYFIVVAFRSGEVSVVSPFRYTLIFWAVIAGWLVFGDWPDVMTWIGIGLIIGSGIYTLYRERMRALGK
jgi:drug/metabolite transporter (DMT)-like permease